jgi:hypothetical protein
VARNQVTARRVEVSMRAALLALVVLAACSKARSIDYSCPSEPARTTVSCADAVGLADKFARAQSLAPESATVKFIRSFGVSEGHGVPAWIVAFSRPSVPYEVVLSARNGRVIAHTT